MKNMEGYMNRVWKTDLSDSKVMYEIRHPAVQQQIIFYDQFEGASFKVSTGDYAPLMGLIIKNLEQAKVLTGIVWT